MLQNFCVCFYSFKKENILGIFSIDLVLFQVKALKYHRKCFVTTKSI